MPFGLLTGLTAALFWGTLDVITALGSRVVGSLRVTAGMQSVTAVLFLAIFVSTGATIPTDPASIALAVLLGLIGAGAYLSYFTGLQFGPIDRWSREGTARFRLLPGKELVETPRPPDPGLGGPPGMGGPPRMGGPAPKGGGKGKGK
jgi:hypothetical protein